MDGLQSDPKKSKQEESESSFWDTGVRVYSATWGRWIGCWIKHLNHNGKKD